MKDIKLSKLTDDDLKQIESWQDKYNDTDGLNSIIWYILGGVPYFHLLNMLNVYDEKHITNNREYSYSLIAKQEDEIVGAIIINIFDLDTKEPSIYIRDIFVSPAHQHKGIGKEILLNLAKNIHDYTDQIPKKIFANVDQTNVASKALFKSLGFDEEGNFLTDMVRFKSDFQNVLEATSTKEK